MRINYAPRGPAGNPSGVNIVYVDSPEIRKKYEDALNEALDGMQAERKEKDKKILDCSADLERRDYQIKKYVEIIDGLQKDIKKKSSDDPDTIDKYINELAERDTLLEVEIAALELENKRLKYDIDNLAAPTIIHEGSAAELEGAPNLSDYHNDVSSWVYLHNINWRMIAFVAILALAVLFFAGLMVGKAM